jgi:hypothetical protein
MNPWRSKRPSERSGGAAGNWSLRELVDRLEQVRVAVQIQRPSICGEER